MCDCQCDGCDESDGDIRACYQYLGPAHDVRLIGLMWHATHYGCSVERIGPFLSREEACSFQAIDYAPLASTEDIKRFDINTAGIADDVWFGTVKIHQGVLYVLGRHSDGRVMPNDRYHRVS